jgi:predicted nucleic acid-binding protein
MRRYLLDSAILAALLNNRSTAVNLTTPWIKTEEVATSILAYGEVVEYIKRLPNPAQHIASLRTLLRGIPPYFLTYQIMERYADLRRQLRPPHGPGLIGDIDTLIAATALERRLTLVTTDTDFQRIAALQVRLVPRPTL